MLVSCMLLMLISNFASVLSEFLAKHFCTFNIFEPKETAIIIVQTPWKSFNLTRTYLAILHTERETA